MNYVNLNKDKTLPGYFSGNNWSFTDINYEDMEIEYHNFNVGFDEKDKEVVIDFPLLKHFEFTGHFVHKYILGFIEIDAPATVKISNMEMKARISETVTKAGYPNFYTPKFSFSIGESFFDIEDHYFASGFVNELLRIFNVLAS